MAAAVKTQSSASAQQQGKQSAGVPEPKQLSKIGQWMRENPGGIATVVDWRAVNK